MSQVNTTAPAAMSLEQQLAAAMAQIEALKQTQVKPKRDTTKLSNGLSLAVSEKGAVSIYGLGRFPVTLYKQQIDRLIEVIGQIKSFRDANDSRLVTKISSK